jgi:hypothetical protein
VLNDPVNFTDPTGLTKGGKQHIDVSPGDKIGDKIKAIQNDKTLSQAEKNRLLEALERQIKNLPHSPRKEKLLGMLKRAKALGKYLGKFCIIFTVFSELFIDVSEAEAPTGE